MKNDCDLICSGPSSKDVIIKTTKIIVANYSILNNNVNNIINKDKEIIWFIGPNYRYFEDINTHHLFTDCINRLVIKPKKIYIKHAGNNYNNKFIKFSNEIKQIFDEVIIQHFNYANGISTGISTLHYCLNNFDKIYTSGIELGYEKTYSYNDDFSYLYTCDKYHTGKKKHIIPVHIKEDLQYMNKLDINKLNKIIPQEKSGLHKYIKNKYY